MFESIDLYCERTSTAFWAEPVNALTNALFIAAAWFSWRRANKLDAGSAGVRLLLGLMCAIGVGSFLFHTFAVTWAQWADVLPIVLFQLAYAWLYGRRVAAFRGLPAGAIVLVYLAAIIAARLLLPPVLNGSLTYLPALVFILAVAGYHFSAQRRERFVMLGAGIFFVAALTARSVDNTLCPYFPRGTHFMWHVCNAVVLYLMMRALLANLPERLPVSPEAVE
jgi:hypothetical protein